MGLFDIFRRQRTAEAPPTKEVQPDDEKSVRVIRGYSATSNHPTVRQLMGNNDSNRNPRDLLPISRVVVELIPELSAGLGIHLDVMGCIVGLDTKNKLFADEFTRWINSVRWRLELTHPFDQSVGLHEFIRLCGWNAMVDGMIFVRAVDANGEDNLKRSQREVILRLHDSERFNFTEFDTDRFRLEYETRGQVLLDVPETDAFKAMSFRRSPSWAWGVPITYDAINEARLAIKAGQNQAAALDLISKAAMLTLIGMIPDSKLLEDDTAVWKEEKMEALTQANKVLQDLTKGIEAGFATGTRYHGFQAFTTPISVDTVSMAEGVQLNPNYSEDRKRQLSSVVLGAGIQPDLVGLSETGGGMSDQKYETTARIMMGTGLRMRNPVWQLIKHFWELHCMRNSILIEADYSPIWDGLPLTEDNAKLKVKEVEAKIAETHVKNMALLYETFGAKAANDYATLNGLVFKAPTINPNPPQA